MSILTTILYSISILQILHSGFSSYEFHQLTKNINSTPYPIPKDIQLECYMGLAIFILTSFFSFNQLEYYAVQPSKANKLSLLSTGQYLKDISLSKANNVHNLIGNDPNGEVTFAPSFVDIQKKREAIAIWLKNTSKED